MQDVQNTEINRPMPTPEPLKTANWVIDGVLELARPLNKGELCQYFRIERTTLEYYNARGLPRFKVGNEVRYYLPDVLDFFRGRGIEPKRERFAHEAEA